EDNIEVITGGSYFERNGNRYIKYDEIYDDMDGVTKNLIKLSKDRIEVVKRGIVNVHMVFDTKHPNSTHYYTPYGEMIMGIKTKFIKVTEAEKNIDINITYDLDINYEFLAACTIDINVKAKEMGNFKL
ncbi:MAG TPA: DUF1934 domain-containing protein, partial [Candidatus Merdenecus merdavium]|nr:DUF1934 domain-containing protein [Candidatus Merdenecus merdavium]